MWLAFRPVTLVIIAKQNIIYLRFIRKKINNFFTVKLKFIIFTVTNKYVKII